MENFLSDGWEIVEEPLNVEYFKTIEENEEIQEKFIKVAQAAAEAVLKIMDILSENMKTIAEAMSPCLERVEELLKTIAAAKEEADEIIQIRNTQRENWRSKSAQAQIVQRVKIKQYERERLNRCEEMRGNMKIRKTGRRTGNRKRKMHGRAA